MGCQKKLKSNMSKKIANKAEIIFLSEAKRKAEQILRYKNRLEPLTYEQQVDLMISGKIFLEHAKLENRPTEFGNDIKNALNSVDKLKEEIKHLTYDFWKNHVLWRHFRNSMTHHSTAIENNKLTQEETKAVLDEFGTSLSGTHRLEKNQRRPCQYQWKYVASKRCERSNFSC